MFILTAHPGMLPSRDGTDLRRIIRRQLPHFLAAAWTGKIWSMTSAPVVITGRNSRR